jgi:hypothetical protein
MEGIEVTTMKEAFDRFLEKLKEKYLEEEGKNGIKEQTWKKEEKKLGNMKE